MGPDFSGCVHRTSLKLCVLDTFLAFQRMVSHFHAAALRVGARVRSENRPTYGDRSRLSGSA